MNICQQNIRINISFSDSRSPRGGRLYEDIMATNTTCISRRSQRTSETPHSLAYVHRTRTNLILKAFRIIMPLSLFLLFHSSFVKLSAQNLVINSGFDSISNCPTSHGQINYAPPWIVVNNTGSASPDLYNSCSINTGKGVPNNVLGYQMSRSGNGYAGIFTYGASSSREYIQTKLTSPLEKDSFYKIMMYVNPVNTYHVAQDALGMYLSQTPIIGDGSSNPLPYIPQISNPTNNILSDTANWILIFGTYKALGGEQYLTIGNFLNDSNTNINTNAQGGAYRCYYYIDDVEVSKSSTVGLTIIENEKVILSPNPFKDNIIINSNTNKFNFIIIYNIQGKKKLQLNIKNLSQIQTEFLPPGLYYYQLFSENSNTYLFGKLLKN